MPFYNYRCVRCGRTLELYRTIARRDDGVICPNPDCPISKVKGQWGWPMERVPTTASFVVGGYNAANGYSRKDRV